MFLQGAEAEFAPPIYIDIVIYDAFHVIWIFLGVANFRAAGANSASAPCIYELFDKIWYETNFYGSNRIESAWIGSNRPIGAQNSIKLFLM